MLWIYFKLILQIQAEWSKEEVMSSYLCEFVIETYIFIKHSSEAQGEDSTLKKR